MTTSYLPPGAAPDAIAGASSEREPDTSYGRSVDGAQHHAEEHRDIVPQEFQRPARATLASRNIAVGGRRTSVRLEPEMWKSLHQIADREKCTIHEVCSLVALRKEQANSLTAALRVFVMLYYKAASTEEGHQRAGHGDIARMRERAEAPEPNRMAFTKAVRPPGSEP